MKEAKIGLDSTYKIRNSRYCRVSSVILGALGSYIGVKFVMSKAIEKRWWSPNGSRESDRAQRKATESYTLLSCVNAHSCLAGFCCKRADCTNLVGFQQRVVSGVIVGTCAWSLTRRHGWGEGENSRECWFEMARYRTYNRVYFDTAQFLIEDFYFSKVLALWTFFSEPFTALS